MLTHSLAFFICCRQSIFFFTILKFTLLREFRRHVGILFSFDTGWTEWKSCWLTLKITIVCFKDWRLNTMRKDDMKLILMKNEVEMLNDWDITETSRKYKNYNKKLEIDWQWLTKGLTKKNQSVWKIVKWACFILCEKIKVLINRILQIKV